MQFSVIQYLYTNTHVYTRCDNGIEYLQLLIFENGGRKSKLAG